MTTNSCMLLVLCYLLIGPNEGFIWSLGGRHSEQTIYRLNDQCHFQESQMKLPRKHLFNTTTHKTT